MATLAPTIEDVIVAVPNVDTTSDTQSSPIITSTTELAALNDDCLINIFRRLRPADLNSIASTCHRFNENSRVVFNLTQSTDLNVLDQRIGVDLEINRYLRNFGDFIRSIILDLSYRGIRYYTRNENLFKSIMMYCGDGQLETLRLIGIQQKIPSDLIAQGQYLFSQLKRVQIHMSANINEILGMIGDDVTDLNVCCWKESNEFFEQRYFPNLEKFSFRILMSCEDRKYKTENLQPFIERHSSLKSIKFHVPAHFDMTIFQQFKQLEQLHLFEIRSNIDALISMTNLRRLLVECESIDIGNFLDQSESTEIMENLSIIKYRMGTTFINGLNRFKNLRVLRLFHVRLFSYNYFNMLKDFNQLRELHLGTCYQIQWEHLISAIRKMPNLQQLTLLNMHYSLTAIELDKFKELVSIYRERHQKLQIIWYDKVDFKIPSGIVDDDYTNFIDIKRKYDKYFADKYGKDWNRWNRLDVLPRNRCNRHQHGRDFLWDRNGWRDDFDAFFMGMDYDE